MLAAQTFGPELAPQHPHKSWDTAVRVCNPNAGEAEKKGSLGLAGQPA